MATSPTDKEEDVRTEENDPAKTSNEEDVVRTEEDEVQPEEEIERTDEVDPSKTTEEAEEEEVQTEQEDEPKEEAIEILLDSVRTEEEEVRTEEEEVRTEEDVVKTEQDVVRTEEVDPVETTEAAEEYVVRTEEDVARTEEVDPVETTEEAEEEVRTEEEDEPKEEAIESLLDSARNLTIEDEEEGLTEEVDPVETTEEAEAEEEGVKTEEEDEHKEEGIESLLDSACDLSIGDEQSAQQTENQNRQEDPITTRRSGKEIDLGSTSDQNPRLDSDPNASARNLGIGDEQSAQEIEKQNLREEFITIRSSDQPMDRGSTSDQNRSLVLRNPSQQMIPRPRVPPYQQDQAVVPVQNHRFGLPEPRWLVVDHFYGDGLGLYGGQWRFRTISPFASGSYLRHQLGIIELPGQPGFVLVCYNQSFGVLQQDRLVPHEAPPQMSQQAPMRPMLPEEEEFVVHLGQVPVRPMVYYHEQNQHIGGIICQPGPVRPPVTYGLRQLEAPLMQPPLMMYTPPPIVNAVPVRSPMTNYNQQQFNQGQQLFRFLMDQQRQSESQQQQSRHSSQGSNDPSSSGESQG